MGKRLLAGVLAMCLLLGGCSTDRGSSGSLENDPPKQEKVSREEPKFVKVKYAYFDDREDPQRYYVGFYALDSAGELFLYDRNQDTLKSIATGIQDFTSGKNSCYYAVGLTETGDYWTNYPNDTWPPFDREIDQVFPGVVLYTDGSLAVCSDEWRLYKPEEWNPQNIAIQEIRFVSGRGAALDQDGTLWYRSWNFGGSRSFPGSRSPKRFSSLIFRRETSCGIPTMSAIGRRMIPLPSLLMFRGIHMARLRHWICRREHSGSSIRAGTC